MVSYMLIIIGLVLLSYNVAYSLPISFGRTRSFLRFGRSENISSSTNQGLVDELKTEAKQRKSDFGNSGRSGFYPGKFSNGFGEFSTMKKNKMKNIAVVPISTTDLQGLDDELRIEAKLSSEEKLEQQKQDDIFNPAIYVLMNENGLKGIWDKMFHQEYSKFSFKLR